MHKNAPEPLKWERDFLYTTGEFSAPLPICPNCSTPIFDIGERDRCEYCGQLIQKQGDKLLEKYLEPPVTYTMDCFSCKGKGTVKYQKAYYNGHKQGHCERCGMRFMD